MSNVDKKAFLEGYVSKTASIAGTGKALTGVAKWAVDNAVMLGTLAPVLAGIGTGALSSKITSPSKLDQQTLQKKLLAIELQEYRTELERRKALAKRKGINESTEEQTPERSLRL
jgi:hypothetical protein